MSPLYVILLVWTGLALLAGGALFLHFRKRRKGSTTAAPALLNKSQPDWDSLSIKQGRVDGQAISAHVRLGEFLSIEGTSVNGEPFQCIVTLESRGHADLIYARAGSAVRRVKSGERGIIQIQNGFAGVINLDSDDALSISLQPTTQKSLEELVARSGFSMALTIATSLTDGTVFRYAARCSKATDRFIKVWDIPSSLSDEAILSRVSARADIAELVERIRDVQSAEAFSRRHQTAAPLESGVCYILGSAGGRQLSFILLSEAALLIVPTFQPDMNLPEFLENLSVQPQMHARFVLRNDRCAVAVPDCDGNYSLANLNESTVVLAMTAPDGRLVDVARVQQDPKVYNLIMITHLDNAEFRNVLLWVVETLDETPDMESSRQSIGQQQGVLPAER